MNVLLLLGFIATVNAAALLVESHPLPETGLSTQYKSEDNHGNYAFGYDENHTSGGSFRKEYGDAFGNKVGSYGLHNSDGRARVVNYVADSAGFRADVHSNEPGVASEDSADVTINKPVVVAAAHAVVTPAVAVAPAPHFHPLTLLHAPVFHAPLSVTSFVSHGRHIVL